MVENRGIVTIGGVEFRFKTRAVAKMIRYFPGAWEKLGDFFGENGMSNEEEFYSAFALCAQTKYKTLDEINDFLDELSLAEFGELKATAISSMDDLVKKNIAVREAEAEVEKSSRLKKSTRKQSALPA